VSSISRTPEQFFGKAKTDLSEGDNGALEEEELLPLDGDAEERDDDEDGDRISPVIDDIDEEEVEIKKRTQEKSPRNPKATSAGEIWRKKTAPIRFEANPPDSRPPFNQILDKSGSVRGDISNLLHFAIVGFGKCGTTTAAVWLNRHPDLQCFPQEIYDLRNGRFSKFLRKMYILPSRQTVEGPDAPMDYLRGYKSPMDLANRQSPALDYWSNVFPTTKLIVGIRHPVRWFESLYNFRVQNSREPETFPHPTTLIGKCYKGNRHTCTDMGDFFLFLRSLGKTLPVNGTGGDSSITEFEQKMYKGNKIPRNLRRIPNPVFLFDVSQLNDDNATRSTQFSQDMQDFLELKTPLPGMPHVKPGKTHADEEQLIIRETRKIDICDDEYIALRKVLMRMARVSATWIREHFLPLAKTDDSVVISLPDHFDQIMIRWMGDPCGGDATRGAGRTILGEERLAQALEASAAQKTV
jgi:hypothetical protein